MAADQISPDGVLRDGNRILFLSKVNDFALREALAAHSEVVERGYEDAVFDFSQITAAYPDAMVGLACIADEGRLLGRAYNAVAPADPYLAGIFRTTNWGGFIAPEQFNAGGYTSETHMSLRRYRTPQEQHAVVDDAMEIVMHGLELDRSVLRGMEWAFNEITDNVLVHAESGDLGGLVQVSTLRKQQRIQLVVADCGRGIPTSLRSGFPALVNDEDAIEESIKTGVTRDPTVGQGNGLAGTLALAQASGGSLRISSQRGQINAFRASPMADYEVRKSARPATASFQGTLVFVEIGTSSELDVGEALRLGRAEPYQPWDIIESRYVDQNDRIVLRMVTEPTGHGSRHSGRAVRTKILNLMGAAGSGSLFIDWEGVPLVSSSFADEVFGKLHAELGPIAFGSRIVHVNVAPLVQSLLDRAIMQRAAQAIASKESGQS